MANPNRFRPHRHHTAAAFFAVSNLEHSQEHSVTGQRVSLSIVYLQDFGPRSLDSPSVSSSKLDSRPWWRIPDEHNLVRDIHYGPTTHLIDPLSASKRPALRPHGHQTPTSASAPALTSQGYEWSHSISRTPNPSVMPWPRRIFNGTINGSDIRSLYTRA